MMMMMMTLRAAAISTAGGRARALPLVS